MAAKASDPTGGFLAERLTRGGDGHLRPHDGLITGYVFKLIRESVGLSQDGLADVLGLDKNTIQGWESGRRPLARMRTATFVDLRRRLGRLGAKSHMVKALETAMEADSLLAQILAVESKHLDPRGHPLATWVNNHAFTEMLAWPLTGETPSALAGIPRVARRGPVPSAPSLPAVERQCFFEHLKIASEQSLAAGDGSEASSVLLRRQAYYMIAWSREDETRTWLSDMQRQEQRRIRRLDGWSPLWVAARSLAVARSCQGDKEPLLHFVDTAIDASDVCEAANLNYWAYWAGATAQAEYTDEFMATDLGPWAGATLLRRLQENLTGPQPYIELSVHSIWALLQRRGGILEEDAQLTSSLFDKIGALLDQGQVSPRSRKKLEQVYFAARVAQSKIGEHPHSGSPGHA